MNKEIDENNSTKEYGEWQTFLNDLSNKQNKAFEQ